MQRWYDVSDIPVREVDYKFIRNFEAYLFENYRYAHNTLIHYLANLRHIIQLAIDDEHITKNPFANISLQVKCPDRGFLTEEEIEHLMNFKFKDKKHETARDIFIFCCFTGLSYTDVFYLTKENIQLAFGDKLWIKGRRQKTGTEYNIPLLNIPKMILEKYQKRQNESQILPVGTGYIKI